MATASDIRVGTHFWFGGRLNYAAEVTRSTTAITKTETIVIKVGRGTLVLRPDTRVDIHRTAV